jgi:hypothetical protein
LLPAPLRRSRRVFDPPFAVLRLRTVACTPLASVRIQKVPPTHPASAAAAACADDGAVGGGAGGGAGGGVGEVAGGVDTEARGLFARVALPSGTWVGDFTGVVKPQSARDTSRYLLEVFHDPLLGTCLGLT